MAFLDLEDRSGRIQLQAKVDVLGAELMDRLLSLDLGDLIGVDGTAFVSRRGELSLRVHAFELLAKSLRPPPDKHHGLTDVETRHRHRELDLMANAETRERFITRARVITTIRRFLDDDGFVEVETPVLQPLYGGAMARPFTTHHNALDRDLYLRIATELYLKRLIVGGLERVYEIGKNFRNEGVDTTHNPEFTVMEWYEAYADYLDVADRCERLVHAVAQAVGYAGEFDFTPPWRRETLAGAVVDRTGVDILALRDRDALAAGDARAGARRLRRPHVARAGRRPRLRPRGADPPAAHVPARLPHRDLAAGQGASADARAGGALRGVRGRDGDRQRVQRAQRPRRAAPALREPAAVRRRRRRGGPALRRGLRPGAGAGDAADRWHRDRDRPAGDGDDRAPVRSATWCCFPRCGHDPARLVGVCRDVGDVGRLVPADQDRDRRRACRRPTWPGCGWRWPR